MEIKPVPNKGDFELRYPFLTRKATDHVGLSKETKGMTTSTPVGRPLLHKDLKELPHKNDWNCRVAVGILGYLQGSTRPNIAMTVHQCACFSNDPMLLHEHAIKPIVQYLMETAYLGIVYNPNAIKVIECFIDADFARGWNQIGSDNS